MFNINMKFVKPIDLTSYSELEAEIGNVRKVKIETKIRALFIGRGLRKYPKKEYIRCKLIRGHKRALRSIIENSNATEQLHEKDNTLSSKVYYWNLLLSSYLQYPKIFEEISPVEVGPVNKQMKKKNLDLNHIKRSFNKEFCQEYFSSPQIRQSYYHYINYLFSELDIESQIKYFGFKCCSSPSHTESCIFKWTILKRYCLSTILEDISIDTYTGDGTYSPLPSIILSNYF